MAAATAQAVSPAPARTGPSLIVQLGVLLFLTAAAAGAGWVSGSSLVGQGAPAEAAAEGQTPAGDHAGEAEAHAPAEHGGSGEGADEPPILRPGVVQLQPITTNLAAPSNVWIRLETAIVFDGETDAAMAEAIHQDLIAYVRTLSLPQIEGASGFVHLRADLEERAAIRSEGRVRKILIRTLLFE